MKNVRAVCIDAMIKNPTRSALEGINRLIAIFATALLLELLLQWWLFYFSGINIPFFVYIETYPDIPIDLRGLVLGIFLVATLIVFIKKLVRQDRFKSITRLTLSGTVICAIAEFVFQLIKIFIDIDGQPNERFKHFIVGVVGITGFGLVFSFLISYQIKTKKTKVLLLYILVFLTIVALAKNLLLNTIS